MASALRGPRRSPRSVVASTRLSTVDSHFPTLLPQRRCSYASRKQKCRTPLTGASAYTVASLPTYRPASRHKADGTNGTDGRVTPLDLPFHRLAALSQAMPRRGVHRHTRSRKTPARGHESRPPRRGLASCFRSFGAGKRECRFGCKDWVGASRRGDSWCIGARTHWGVG